MRTRVLLVAWILVVGLAGCVQMPTEKQQVVDLRPQIAFRVEGGAIDPAQARVFVDNLDMGPLASYLEGRATLRVLPGNHVIRVEAGGAVVLNERLYIADGVTRTLLVN